MRVFGDYIEAVVQAVEGSLVPEPFRYWSALSSVLGALGRSCWYDAGAFKIYPNMFVVLVAGPGRGKSLGLIVPFETVFKGLSAPATTKKGDDNYNYKLEQYGLLDTPLRMVNDRITPEKLCVDMAAIGKCDLTLTTPSGDQHWDSSVTLVTSEFGTFMNRNDTYLQMFMTDMWDSKSEFAYRTKTAGDFLIKGPCLNWIACATPDQLVDNLPENARSQGLLSRLFIVYYDGERVPFDITYGKANANYIDNLKHDLSDIAKMRGEFVLDSGATELARSDVGAGLLPVPSDPNLSEYAQRRPSQLFKIAMGISAARRSNRIITVDDWETAKRMMFSAEAHMHKPLARFGVGKAGKVVSNLIIWLAEYESINRISVMPLSKFKREILNRVTSPNEVGTVVEAMGASNLIRVEGAQVRFGNGLKN
jgi:hypothetical protein